MGKQRKKSNKELRQEAQNIQIVVTCDNNTNCDDENSVEPEIPNVKVLKNTCKNLAFEDKIEYSVEGDVFNQVIFLIFLVTSEKHWSFLKF